MGVYDSIRPRTAFGEQSSLWHPQSQPVEASHPSKIMLTLERTAHVGDEGYRREERAEVHTWGKRSVSDTLWRLRSV